MTEASEAAGVASQAAAPASRLREYRLAFGMTQPAFARWLGISERTLWNIEHSVYSPQMATRRKIMRRLRRPWSEHEALLGAMRRKKR